MLVWGFFALYCVHLSQIKRFFSQGYLIYVFKELHFLCDLSGKNKVIVVQQQINVKKVHFNFNFICQSIVWGGPRYTDEVKSLRVTLSKSGNFQNVLRLTIIAFKGKRTFIILFESYAVSLAPFYQHKYLQQMARQHFSCLNVIFIVLFQANCQAKAKIRTKAI